MKLKNKNRTGLMVALFVAASLFSACKKFLDIQLPTDTVTSENVYISDLSTASVLSGILYTMLESGVINGDNIGLKAGLYADELQNVKPQESGNENFYKNGLSLNAVPGHWSSLYKQVYTCNLALEGINQSTADLSFRNQWLGEALFCRAYLYFQLVNLYGDVPLALVPDYRVTNKLSRSPSAQVYQQIIADLKSAQSLLGDTYLNPASQLTTERGRPNRFSATALLARVYLYTGDWVKAEAEASSVISNTTDFQLAAPASVFLTNSKETIWALVSSNKVSPGYTLFNKGMPAVVATIAALSSGTPLSQVMVNAFEPGDVRFTAWVRTTSTTTPAQTFYYPNKYKLATPGAESFVALRLGEQYLIRAEARAQQNNMTGAVQDLNLLRSRSRPTPALDVLPDYPASISQADCLVAIAQERRVELFSEFGSRFFDLKRTGTIDAVMTVAAPAKGGVWNSQRKIWPIPPDDIRINPNLTQAPGY
jgi:hypothetical protein